MKKKQWCVKWQRTVLQSVEALVYADTKEEAISLAMKGRDGVEIEDELNDAILSESNYTAQEEIPCLKNEKE